MKWAVCNANNCHKTATTPMAFVVLRVPRFSAQPPSHFVHYVQELAWQKREKIEKLHNLWHGWSGWKIANKALCIIVHILPHKAFHNQKGLSPGPYATLIAVDDLGAWVCRCGLGWTCSHHTIQTTQATWTISQLTLCPQILHFVFGGPCCGKLLCTYSWFWSPPFLPIPPTEVALFRCQPNSADSSHRTAAWPLVSLRRFWSCYCWDPRRAAARTQFHNASIPKVLIKPLNVFIYLIECPGTW